MDLIIGFLGGAIFGIIAGFWVIVSKKVEERKRKKRLKKLNIE